MSIPLPLNEVGLLRARKALLRKVAEDCGLIVDDLSSLVTSKDGDMGSFSIGGSDPRSGTEQIAAEYDFLDSDGMPVLITFFSRDGRGLSSVDFWRVDFNPLKAFPDPGDLIARRTLTD